LLGEWWCVQASLTIQGAAVSAQASACPAYDVSCCRSGTSQLLGQDRLLQGFC
jgi:hypothetical protein